MKKKSLVMATCVALALVLALGLAGGAWAIPQGNPDTVNLNSILTNPNSTINGNGNGRNVNVTGTVNANDTIDLSFTVTASGTGTTSTTYPDTVKLTATTIVKPAGASDVSVTGLADCTFPSPASVARATTFNESATITAPGTAGAYQVKILADDGRTGSGKINQDFFFINFTVVVPACTPADTTLELGTPDCVVYHATSVSLSATLTENGHGPLGGKTITFYVDGNPVGMADTNSVGVATLTYNPSQLAVGNHDLSAEWQSDDPCLKSAKVTGGVLGVQYLFLGFQQPINGDNSSLFSGRTIPVKIKIADYNGVSVPDADCHVYYNFQTPALVGTDAEPLANTNGDSGNTMRYDPVAQQYIFNWDVAGLDNGAYWIWVGMGEGNCASQRSVLVTLKKKGSK